jgi:hypothetical protein
MSGISTSVLKARVLVGERAFGTHWARFDQLTRLQELSVAR